MRSMTDTGNDDLLAMTRERQADVTSERSLVLCSATRLEQRLGEILGEFLMSGGAAERLIEGPLSTLNARALACQSLALVDDHEFADCEAIARISMEFRRSEGASLEADFTGAICRKLHFRDRARAKTGRENFASAVDVLLGRLANRSFYIGHEKRTSRRWPM